MKKSEKKRKNGKNMKKKGKSNINSKMKYLHKKTKKQPLLTDDKLN